MKKSGRNKLSCKNERLLPAVCPAALRSRIRVRITRIHMFFGLLDPNPGPLVKGMDPRIRIQIQIHTKNATLMSSKYLCNFQDSTLTFGSVIEMGWPSMTASASMPPTPQPITPRPLIMVVWESVPTTLSGYSTPVVAVG